MTKKNLLSGAAIGVLFAMAQTADAGTLYLAQLQGGNEPPPTVGSKATGLAVLILNDAETQATITVTHNEALVNPSPVILGHIHRGPAGVAGPVIFPFPNPNSPVGPLVWAIPAADVVNLKNLGLYANIHTQQNPGGDIRGQLFRAALAPAATNTVQSSLAAALDVSAGFNADLDSVLVQTNLRSAAAQAQALDTLAGRGIYIQGREGIETMQGFAGALLDRAGDDRLGGAVVQTPGVDLFAAIGDDFGTRLANAAEVGSRVTRPSLTGGLAYRLGGSNQVGVAVSYAHGLETFKFGLGKTDAKTTAVDGFASIGVGPLVVDGVVGYGWSDFDSTRVLASFGRAAAGATKGSTWGATGKISYPMTLEAATIAAPYLEIDYTHTNIDAYTETDAASLDLVVPNHTVTNSNGEIGAALSTTVGQGWGALIPRVQVGWRHALDNGKNTIATQLVGSPVAFGTPILATKDAAHVAVSLTARMTGSIEASIGYRGLLGSSRFDIHALEARVMVPL